MKNISLTLTILIAYSIAANTQSYQPFPTGPAKWDVARCWYFYNPGWYDKYTFTIDGKNTLYNGATFKKIYVTNHHLPGTVYDTIYPTVFFGGIRESNKQIFIYQLWASTDTTVQLVYDFNNTNIGDTIYTDVLSGYPNKLGHLITNVDSVLIGTIYHKRLHLEDPNNSFNTEYWIEGIGSSWGLPFASFWSATDNSYDLTCFYKNEQLKYGNPAPTYSYCLAPLPMIECDSLTTAADEQSYKKTNFVSLYPNPVSEVLTLDFNNAINEEVVLDIFNGMGVLVRSKKLPQNQSQIDIGDLNNGIYLVMIKSKDWVESKRLVVQR